MIDPAASTLPNSNAPAESGRVFRRVVPLLMLVIATGHFNRIAITVAGTERIIPYGGVTPAQMGAVYSGFLVLYTLAMVPAGALIDRFGARGALSVLLFGSAVFVAATCAAGIAVRSGLYLVCALFAVRSLMGVINSPLHPAAARMVYGQIPPHARSLANGLVTFAACVGMASTWYGFGLLIDYFDWPSAFLITAWMTLGVAVLWTLGTRGLGNQRPAPAGGPNPEDSEPAIGFSHVFLHRSILCLTGSYAALGYFQYVFFYWMEYYFERVEKLGIESSRRYSTLIILTMGLGMICGGWLADRLSLHSSRRVGRRIVPAYGMAASGISFALGLLSSDSRILAICFALGAFLIGACEGSFWTMAVELGGARGGLAAALMNTGGNGGGFISPFATPVMGAYFATYFGELNGWRISLAIAGAIAFIGALLWFGVDTEARRKPDPLSGAP